MALYHHNNNNYIQANYTGVPILGALHLPSGASLAGIARYNSLLFLHLVLHQPGDTGH